MAKVKKKDDGKVKVTLTEDEAKGLAYLMYHTVSGGTHKELGLVSLGNELVAVIGPSREVGTDLMVRSTAHVSRLDTA